MSERFSNNFMDTDELDAETIQQIIDMEEKTQNLEVDYLLAQQMNSNDDMSDILEQIRQIEEQDKKKLKEQEINEARLLREEQDREYEESLLQDMQKENEKTQKKSPIVEDVTEDFNMNHDLETLEQVEPMIEEPKKLTTNELRMARLKHFSKS